MNILITGGSGSLGNALVTHMLEQDMAERICIYSRGEHAQATMRARYNDDHRLRWFIGDVRDRTRLTRAMRGCDVVIHAAALKRIEVGAYNPEEMTRTNVIGAINVIEAAYDAKVLRVLMISTDKAVQPISPYGHSKALAEALFLAANETHGWPGRRPVYSVCRYGNIAGSAGSIIPLWREQLRAGNTVTVTDPDATRFWMTMQDALFVIWSALRQDSPTLVVPQSVPAYRVGDLATAMGAHMAITGLPPWEKLHESLVIGETSEDAPRMSIDDLRAELGKITEKRHDRE